MLRALVAQVTTPGEEFALIDVLVISFVAIPPSNSIRVISTVVRDIGRRKTIRNNLLNVNCDRENKVSIF